MLNISFLQRESLSSESLAGAGLSVPCLLSVSGDSRYLLTLTVTPFAGCLFPPQVAPVIKARMMEYGTTMVGYQPQGDKVNFFRMVISNPAATFEDIDFLIEEIERLGQDL